MYLQYAGVIAAFSAIMYLSRKKVSLAWTMFTATAIVAVTSGLGFSETWAIIFESLTDTTTVELVAAVLAIGVFSIAMKELSLLDRTVAGLTDFLGNIKAAIMTVPALIGSLPVLGGAVLSAPLVDRLGDSLAMEPDQKAAANLAFRHGMFFIFPFSPGLIMASKLSGFAVQKLISWFWPMSLAIWGAGYLSLLRKATPVEDDNPGPGQEERSPGLDEQGETGAIARPGEKRLSGFVEFARHGSPLFLALILGMSAGLPVWISLSGGIALALILGLIDRKPLPKAQMLVKGANWSQAVAMLWIMVFRGLVSASPVFPALVAEAGKKGISRVLVALVLPLILGFVSASQSSTVAVFLPILVPAAESEFTRMAYVAVIYGSSFLSYFFSPLHLCQVLTCEYFKVDIFSVYRRNWPVLVGLGAAILGYCALLAF